MWNTVYGRFSVSRVNAPRFDIFLSLQGPSLDTRIEPTEKKESSLYIPGLKRKELLAVRHVGILEIGKILRHTQMCAREAVVPSEFVFVPHGPKEAQKKSSCGEHVARAAQKHLPGRGRFARKADHLQVSHHHTRSGAAEDGEQSEILQIDNGKDRKSTRLNSSHVAISYAVF